MEFQDPNHVYQVAPPYGSNRELPAKLMIETLSRLKSEKSDPSDLDEQALWQEAKEFVEANHKMVWFGVKALFMPDMDKLDREIAALYLDHCKDKAIELESGKRLAQVKEKITSINNLVIGGVPVTTWEDFYAKAPTAMVQWLIGAIRCTMTLSQAEIKNFLPE